LLRQLLHRHQNLAGCFRRAKSSCQPEQPPAAETRQGAPDFGLEKHDHRQADVGNNQRQNGMQRLQACPHRNQVKADDHYDAQQDGRRARAAHHHQALVDQERHHQDVDGADRIQLRQRRQVS
jgi:hypothetical protein